MRLSIVSILCIAALMLGGCMTFSKNGNTIGSVSSQNANPDVEASSRICDVDSLATTRSSYIQQAQQLRSVSGSASSSTDLDKMQAFEAEIDAQYRSVTASCRAFIECMEAHGYDEGACRMSQRRWEDSEQAFTDLAIRLREIGPTASPPPAPRPTATASPAPGPRGGPCKPRCATIATVFTDCCTD